MEIVCRVFWFWRLWKLVGHWNSAVLRKGVGESLHLEQYYCDIFIELPMQDLFYFVNASESLFFWPHERKSGVVVTSLSERYRIH